MKIKQAMRFQLRGMIRPAIIYYAIMLFVNITACVIEFFIQSGNMWVNGAEMPSLIFLFVLGMNSFKSQFFLFLQNGISRKTLFFGFLLAALSVSAGIWAIDSIYPRLFINLSYESLFANVYGLSGFIGFLNGAAWTIFFGFFALCVGFLITTLYYNMNKVVKVIVSAGVPILLFVIIPIVEAMAPSFAFYKTVFQFISWCMGVDVYQNSSITAMSRTMNSFRPLCVFITGSAFTSGLSYLLIRRTTIKE